MMIASPPRQFPDELRHEFDKYLAAHVKPEAPRPSGQKLRVAYYARVSSDEQVEHGHGMTSQPETILDFIRRQSDWILVASFSDPGVSGRHDRRKEYNAMIKMVKAGQLDVIVVDRIDRLHRNLQNLLQDIHLFDEFGVRLVSVAEGIDFRDPWGRFILVMLGMLAQVYVEKLSRETSIGCRSKALIKGLKNGRPGFGQCTGRCSRCTDPNGKGYCPNYGLKDIGTGAELCRHPVEYPALVEMFKLYCTNDYSDGAMARDLNQRTVALPNGTILRIRPKTYPNERYPGSGRFNKDSIRRILTNEIYAGISPYYGKDKNGRRPTKPTDYALATGEPFISRELWLRAQELRQLRGHAPQGGEQRSKSRVYLLTERAKCVCGRRLKWNNTTSGAYGFCPGRREKTCNQPTIRVDRAHAQAGHLFKRLQFPSEVVKAVTRDLMSQDDLRRHERQLAEAEQRFAQVRKAYDDRQIDWATLVQAERDYNRSRGQLLACRIPCQAPQSILDLLNSCSALWDELRPDDQRLLVQLLVKEALIEGGQVKSFVLYPPFNKWLDPD